MRIYLYYKKIARKGTTSGPTSSHPGTLQRLKQNGNLGNYVSIKRDRPIGNYRTGYKRPIIFVHFWDHLDGILKEKTNSIFVGSCKYLRVCKFGPDPHQDVSCQILSSTTHFLTSTIKTYLHAHKQVKRHLTGQTDGQTKQILLPLHRPSRFQTSAVSLQWFQANI